MNKVHAEILEILMLNTDGLTSRQVLFESDKNPQTNIPDAIGLSKMLNYMGKQKWIFTSKPKIVGKARELLHTITEEGQDRLEIYRSGDNAYDDNRPISFKKIVTVPIKKSVIPVTNENSVVRLPKPVVAVADDVRNDGIYAIETHALELVEMIRGFKAPDPEPAPIITVKDKDKNISVLQKLAALHNEEIAGSLNYIASILGGLDG